MPQYKVTSIDPRRTALVVVDMQNDFVAVGAPFEVEAARAAVPQLKRAISFCREQGIHVIYTAHVHREGGFDLGLFRHNHAMAAGEALRDGTAGAEIYSEIAPERNELLIKKHRFSAFFGTDLEVVLRGLNVTTVVLGGVTTENCVHATARDALFRDFEVVVLSDATATPEYHAEGIGFLSADEVQRQTLIILAGSTADVMSVNEFLTRTLPMSASAVGRHP